MICLVWFFLFFIWLLFFKNLFTVTRALLFILLTFSYKIYAINFNFLYFLYAILKVDYKSFNLETVLFRIRNLLEVVRGRIHSGIDLFIDIFNHVDIIINHNKNIRLEVINNYIDYILKTGIFRKYIIIRCFNSNCLVF